MKKSIYIMVLAVVLLFVGCNENHSDLHESALITILITKNYGQEFITKQEFPLVKNMTVMDALNKTGLEVDLSYGGTFVNGINGYLSQNDTRSGIRYDWFYFVNGIFADIGSLDYFLQPDDVVWWDYHAWEASGGTTTAAAGFYLEMLANGYDGNKLPVTVMSANFENATDFKNMLVKQGIDPDRISATDVSESLLANPKGPTVILGSWEALKTSEHLQKINRDYQRAGLFSFFNEQNQLLLFNDRYQQMGNEMESAGLIFSLGKMSGDVAPLLVITATDTDSYEQFLSGIIEEPKSIWGLYAMAWAEERQIPLPYIDQGK